MGNKVSQGNIPAMEAGSVGPADQNESTPVAQRAAGGEHLPATDGPRIDPNTGAYLPAEYETVASTVSADGTTIPHTIIRRDR